MKGLEKHKEDLFQVIDFCRLSDFVSFLSKGYNYEILEALSIVIILTYMTSTRIHKMSLIELHRF